MVSCFVTDVWAWQNRTAARKFLRQNDYVDSLDMAFVTLRGRVAQALHNRQYNAANNLLRDFMEETHFSKTRLKKTMAVLGMCITTGTEEFENLKCKLTTSKLATANLEIVRGFEFLCVLLVYPYRK